VTDNGAGIAEIVYQINSVSATLNYTGAGIEHYPNVISTSNIRVGASGDKNTIQMTIIDGVGNITLWSTGNIKINNNPPNLLPVFDIPATAGSVENSANETIRIYTNAITAPLKLSGTGITTVDVSVTLNENGDDYFIADSSLAFRSGSYHNIQLTKPGYMDDGVRLVRLYAKDDWTAAGGPSSTKIVEIALDRNNPTFEVTTTVSGKVSLVNDDVAIKGQVFDQNGGGSNYASGADVYYTINGVFDSTGKAEKIFKADKSDANNWQIKISKVLENSGRSSGAFVLTLQAKDKAGNYAANGEVKTSVTVGFTMAPKYVRTNALAINSAVINENITDDTPAVRSATARLSGIVDVPALTDTLVDFTVYDTNDQPLTDVSGLDGVTIGIQISKEAYEAARNSRSRGEFKIHVLNSRGEWEILPGEQPVTEVKDNATGKVIAHNIEAAVEHFSTYKVFYVLSYAADLKDVIIYPNPYKGSDGDLANGEDSDDYRNKVFIENLTESARAKIYTISGELVTTLEVDAPRKLIEWDLANSRGGRVASGIYIILVTDEENNKFIGRLTVVR
jgi:hypothetical protein